MSNIQKINDITVLSDEQFYEKYGESKTDFVSQFHEEDKEGKSQVISIQQN